MATKAFILINHLFDSVEYLAKGDLLSGAKRRANKLPHIYVQVVLIVLPFVSYQKGKFGK